MKLGTRVGHIMLDGDPATPTESGTFKIYGRRLCLRPYNPRPMSIDCGQTAGCIKMPFGTEEGLGPGHIVLDGEPSPQNREHSSPNFRSMSIVAKRLDGSR